MASTEEWVGDSHTTSSIGLTPEKKQEFDDGCHKFEHSVVFFILVSIIGVAFGLYAIVLYFNRLVYKAYDVIYCLLTIFGTIRFCTLIFGYLMDNDYNVPVNQTACKMATFTLIGLPPVLTFLILTLVLYGWIGCGRCSWWPTVTFHDLNKMMRRLLGWFVLFLFSLEGAIGMIPAIFVDGINGKCVYTNFQYSPSINVLIQLFTLVLIPYIIPFAIMVYPLYQIWKIRNTLEDPMEKTTCKNIFILATTYIVVHLPMVFMILGVTSSLYGHNLNWKAVCRAEAFFNFFQDAWYLLLPLLILFNDVELQGGIPGIAFIKRVSSKVIGVVDGKSRYRSYEHDDA